MTQEEKAKCYDEAIIRGSRLWESDMITRENYEYIFPEVKESKDDMIRKDCLKYLDWEYHRCSHDEDKIKIEKCIAWLKKKDEQKPIEWSEKDKHILNNIYNFVANNLLDKNRGVCADECLKWLNLLKDRVQSQNTIADEELAQAKKDAYNDALDKIEYHSGEPTFDDGWSAAIWYLKKRNAQLLSTWEPSNEQMKALEESIMFLGTSCVSISQFALKSLYRDLKKLKE